MKTGSETVLRSEGRTQGGGELDGGGQCCLLLLKLALYMVYRKDMTPAEQVPD